MSMPRPLVLCAAILCAAIIPAATGISAAPQVANSSTLAQAARLNNLGTAYMNQQLFEKALKSFEEASAADPKLQSARTNSGIALLGLGRADEAKKILQGVVADDPKDPRAWYNLGLVAKTASDSPTAVTAFRHVTEIDPNDADAWYFLGAVYSSDRKFPEAIDAFQRALKLNPLHASAEFGLARALQQSGDSAQAHTHMQRFQYVTQSKLGAPVSLAYGEQGKYSRAEESAAAPEKVPPAIAVRFVDVTEEAGIAGKPGPAVANDLASSLGPGACFLDYDGDGKQDLLLGGNFYQSKPEVGIYDASYGLLLHGNGKGDFTTVNAKQSGLFIKGQVRDMTLIKAGKKTLVIVPMNNEAPKFFTVDK